MKNMPPVCDYVVEQAANEQSPKTIAWAQRLGYAGLLPFIVPVLVLMLGNEATATLALQALLAYAAVILTFVGALHWGSALLMGNGSLPVRLLLVSVVPSLVAWLSLLLPLSIGLLAMVIAFIAVYGFDRGAWRDLPWFLTLRRNLTTVAASSLFIAWLLI